jgi:hypothetical protein
VLPFAEWLTADMVSRPEARALLALMATQNPLNPHSRSLVELLHAGGDDLLRDDSTRLAGPRALLPPCRRAYLYRPMKVGTMTPCDLGQRTLLERVVSTARRASSTMSSA